MASMIVRIIEDGLKQQLGMRAASHGWSMEEEARDILRTALSAQSKQPTNLAVAIRNSIKPLGGVLLEEASREAIREAPDFAR